jgi:RNA polymerase sigma-70 factor (ECF subfamily)
MLFNFFKRKNYLQFSNEELLDAYRDEADNEASGVLYDRNLVMVFGVCNKYLENEAAAQDAVLDIFEQLCEKVKLHDIQNFESWLYILAKNHCLMQLRKRKQQVIMPIDDYSHLPSTDELSHEHHHEKELEIQSLESCLKSLPTEQNIAVTLFYLEEKSYKEVAEIMKEDINKVRSFIQNGRRNLKICMGSKFIE